MIQYYNFSKNPPANQAPKKPGIFGKAMTKITKPMNQLGKKLNRATSKFAKTGFGKVLGGGAKGLGKAIGGAAKLTGKVIGGTAKAAVATYKVGSALQSAMQGDLSKIDNFMDRISQPNSGQEAAGAANSQGGGSNQQKKTPPSNQQPAAQQSNPPRQKPANQGGMSAGQQRSMNQFYGGKNFQGLDTEMQRRAQQSIGDQMKNGVSQQDAIAKARAKYNFSGLTVSDPSSYYEFGFMRDAKRSLSDFGRRVGRTKFGKVSKAVGSGIGSVTKGTAKFAGKTLTSPFRAANGIRKWWNGDTDKHREKMSKWMNDVAGQPEIKALLGAAEGFLNRNKNDDKKESSGSSDTSKEDTRTNLNPKYNNK